MIQKNIDNLQRLVAVANGDRPPDLVVADVSILDVFTGSLFAGNVWVSESWIAYVGERAPALGPQTSVINGRGCVAVPGYIDAHCHADLYYNPATFGDFAIKTGTTTVFSDSHDMVSSIGIGGFREVLRKGDQFAVKYLWGVPAASPPYPDVEGGELFSYEDIKALFEDFPECVSISEVSSYIRILRNEEEILRRILIARSLGRNVEGHTLGASYDRLNTLVAAGITSCHESVREADVRNRLRLGLYTMVRHSSIRTDLEVLAPVIDSLPKDVLILVSDGVFAHDLCARGYMDFVIAEAIRFGLNPVDAIKMCTLNPARYFKLDGHIGSVAPGRIADILLLEGLHAPTPLKVVERGRLVADQGRLVTETHSFPDLGTRYHPYRFKTITRDDLRIRRTKEGPIAVIDVVDQTVTRRVDLTLEDRDGTLLPSSDGDVRKIVYRTRNSEAFGKGFVRGLGCSIGGIASSIAHETHGLLLLGFDDNDILQAAEEVLAMEGGVVLVDKGVVLARLPLPCGAIMSNLTVEELAGELRSINGIIRERGSALEDPLWTIGFLTFTAIVELRITASGVYDVKHGEIVF
jgi:adenine deaminase